MTRDQAEEMILPFCSTLLRPPFRDPFTLGGWRYATDGCIAVRVPAMPGEGDTKDCPNAAALPWKHAEVTEWVAPGPYTGVVRPAEVCECCDASGTTVCTKCGQECPCEDCDGNGMIPEEYTVARVGKAYVKGEYIVKILRLSRPVVAADDLGGGKSTLIRFRFDGGGEGLVMSIDEDDVEEGK